MTIACCHPGKHGDALYTLPTIRALCEKYQTKADFYTSDYCEPLRSLFEAQDCIANFYVAPNYVIERMDMGVQPRFVPVDAGCYEAVFQMGFQRVPDCSIPDFIAREAEVRPYPIRYDLTAHANHYVEMFTPDEYTVLAPRQSDDYAPLFQDIIDQSPIPCIIIGGKGDEGHLKYANHALMTDHDYLITAAIIGRAKAFVGLMSSQLAIANGFPIPRISPHDGHSWNMSHVVRSEFNYYPIKPSADQVLSVIDGVKPVESYSKTIELSDYETSDTFQHIQNMTGVLAGMYTPWQTEFRLWEYGAGLKVLREANAKTVLEVGGGSSMFAASAIWAGFDVTVLDPENYLSMFQRQSERIGRQIPFVHADFFDYPEGQMYDAVVSISTIEHVPNDADFFSKLLRHVKPNGVLFLTSDFHPSGQALFGGHLRCYNAEMFTNLICLAKEHGFEVFGGEPDYQSFEPLVHGMYSFASMALKRKTE